MKKKFILAAALIASFFIGTSKAYAADSFTINNLNTDDHSATIFVDDSSYDGLTINTNVTFYELNDYILYKVQLKNTTEYDYKINGISNDNTDSHITVEHELEGGQDIVPAGGSATLDVKLIFSTDLSTNERLSSDQLYYLNALNITLDAQKLAPIQLSNPQTLDTVVNYVALAAVCGAGLVIATKYRKKAGALVLILGVSLIGLKATNTRAVEYNYIDDDIVVEFNGAHINIVSPKAKWDSYLVGPLTKSNIATINFAKWSDAQALEGYTPVDISYPTDGSNEGAVFLYYKENGEGLYDVIISSPYGYSEYKDSDMTELFSHLNNVTEINLTYLDMYNVTNMTNTFNGITRETGVGIASISDMQKLTTLTFGDHLNTSRVASMRSAFGGLVHLQTFTPEKLDVRSVTDMHYLFAKNTELKSLDLSSWDTSNVVDMSGMFNDAYGLNEINLSNFNTSNVKDMSLMFAVTGTTDKTIALDLSSFDTSNVENMFGMFAEFPTPIDLSGFDTTSVTDMSYMFQDIDMVTLDITNFDTSNVENMRYMFSSIADHNYHGKLEKVLLGDNFVTDKVKDFEGMFAAFKGKEISLKNLNLQSVTNRKAYQDMFMRTKNLEKIYVKEMPSFNYGYDYTVSYHTFWSSKLNLGNNYSNYFTVWDYDTYGDPLNQ